MMPRQPQFQRSGRYQNALTDWAKGLADSGVAVTVAFGSGRGAVVTCPSERNAEEIVRKGIKRLNTTLLRQQANFTTSIVRVRVKGIQGWRSCRSLQQ